MNISDHQWLEQLNKDIDYWSYMAKAAKKEYEQALENIKSLSADRDRLLKRIHVATPTSQQLAKAINDSMGWEAVQVVTDKNGSEIVVPSKVVKPNTSANASDFCSCTRPHDDDGITCSKCGKPVF